MDVCIKSLIKKVFLIKNQTQTVVDDFRNLNGTFGDMFNSFKHQVRKIKLLKTLITKKRVLRVLDSSNTK